MVRPARTDDGARTRTLWRGQEKERGACSNGAHAPPSRPRMLSWQQMASFNVHREELHDLLQQRGTREKPSLSDWAHLRRW